MQRSRLKARFRGAMKLLTLHMLSEGPNHAYGVMRRLGEVMGFMPSSGAFFPVLKSLVRNGLVEVEEVERDGRRVKVYRLSEGGRAVLESHRRQVEDALRLARSFKRFSESGLSRVFRVVEDIIESMGGLSDRQVEELRKAILDFEYRVLEIIRGGGSG
ncbi:PadR family transcriptional regulator [Infirmifilum lucidum]|uniref:PadR family transcriptional regulator n=1 Tax=Infirmifilum lucidum TaxID=2776706 RepID=A0A7L9FJ56_9CREN|nr:PadR family transcriptional regulator [Infirmifilum lucidum]QOJ79053.1 PadR family transcriptional regulator [Infirmifilum lucidum]